MKKSKGNLKNESQNQVKDQNKSENKEQFRRKNKGQNKNQKKDTNNIQINDKSNKQNANSNLDKSNKQNVNSDLDNRKKKVLQAIVEEYINTAEPVSSNSLVNKNNLDYSSATIRNDMAQLEKIGFLDKPHTSSGRVPSAKGYRYYVNELLNENDLSLEEIQYIKSKLTTKVTEIEDLTKLTTSTISEITHYTTVAVGPRPEMQIIQEIKFVRLGARMVMVVILTDSGMIKETIIRFDEDISEEQVETLNQIFNTKLRGKPLSKIDKPMAEYIFLEINYNVQIIKAIIEQINKIIDEENSQFILEGAKKAFDLPEFQSMKVAKNFVNLIDAKEEMMDILNSGDAKDINVFIGDENENMENSNSNNCGNNGENEEDNNQLQEESLNSKLKDFSIITFKHVLGGKDLGTIGIIGPRRMDYSKVISVMKYISKKLNNTKAFNDEKSDSNSNYFNDKKDKNDNENNNENDDNNGKK